MLCEVVRGPHRRNLYWLHDLVAFAPQCRESPEWQAATEALILAAEDRGPLMDAHTGMLRALNRHVERFSTSTGEKRIGDDASWRGIDDTPSADLPCFAVDLVPLTHRLVPVNRPANAVLEW